MTTKLSEAERKRAAQFVVRLISDTCGREAADYWAWERTPMPAGLPLDSQLLEGLKMAARGTKPGPWTIEVKP
jgi:hypothetical protein